MNGNVEFADLEGLPPELLSEIKTEKFTEYQQIVDVLKMSPRGMCLDKLMIGLYRIYGVIYKRHVITAKLYRMAKNDLVIPIESRKGWYMAPSGQSVSVQRQDHKQD